MRTSASHTLIDDNHKSALRCAKAARTYSGGPIWIGEALKRSPLREAPLTHAIALASQAIEAGHWDPAGRFIFATARVLDATLVTAGERLIAARTLKVLPN